MTGRAHVSVIGGASGTDHRRGTAARGRGTSCAACEFDWPIALVRFSVAALLLASAILKALSPAESATLAAGYSIPPWLTTAVVQLELLLAAALVAGCWQRWMLRLTTGLFTVFAAFSLYRAVAGFESCGCFGAIKVNPWFTFVLDLVVLACLGLAARRESAIRDGSAERTRTTWAVAAYVLVAPPILVLMLWTGPTRLEAGGAFIEYGELVILEPENWIDRKFPLASYLSPEVDVAHGDWTVFVYHYDCPKCREAIPKYLALADRLSMQGGDSRVLFVEVPPYGTTLPSTRAIRHARLRDEREWFVQAPVEISLSSGVVTDTSLELPSIRADQLALSTNETHR